MQVLWLRAAGAVSTTSAVIRPQKGINRHKVWTRWDWDWLLFQPVSPSSLQTSRNTNLPTAVTLRTKPTSASAARHKPEPDTPCSIQNRGETTATMGAGFAVRSWTLAVFSQARQKPLITGEIARRPSEPNYILLTSRI